MLFPDPINQPESPNKGGTGRLVTVERHVPMRNSMGGTLVVRRDNGAVGRHGPICLRKVKA